MVFTKGHKINLGRSSWNKNLTKENNEIMKKNSERAKGEYKLGIRKVWSEGLTAETDDRIKKLTEKGSKTQREMHKQGKLKPTSGCFKKGCQYGKKNKGNLAWNKLNLDKEQIIKLYKQENNSSIQIAKKFNCTNKVILRILKENNIDVSLSNLRKRLFKLGKLKAPSNGFKKGDKLLIERTKERRKTQIFPIKDSSIEVKIQDFLTELKIEYLTHKYMHIEHGYQCDIFIPSMNLIIECDGDYWHGNPLKNKELAERQIKQRENDEIRTKELKEKGYRVIRLWENEIKQMNIEKFKEIFMKSI